MVSGKVISKEKQEVVDFATVYLKGTTYGCTTNEEGIYHLHAPAGKYTLVVSAIGYKTIEKPVTLVHGERIKMNVMIDPSVTGRFGYAIDVGWFQWQTCEDIY